MLDFSAGQFEALDRVGRAAYESRLAAHLAAGGRLADRAEAESVARQALTYGGSQGLDLEDDIAALADVMVEFKLGRLDRSSTSWVMAIIKDPRARKGSRLRECLAIERRLAAAPQGTS